MNSRDVVAIILAVSVLIFVMSGTALRNLVLGDSPPPQIEQVQAWKDIINVILGALAGYIVGKGTNSNGVK